MNARSTKFDSISKRILSMVSLTIVVCGLVWFVQVWRFSNSAQRVDGKIVRVIEARARVFNPVFQFSDEAGQVHEIEALGSSVRDHFTVGETIQVMYLRDDPKSASIESKGFVWIRPAVLTGFGLIFGYCASQYRPKSKTNNFISRLL